MPSQPVSQGLCTEARRSPGEAKKRGRQPGTGGVRVVLGPLPPARRPAAGPLEGHQAVLTRRGRRHAAQELGRPLRAASASLDTPLTLGAVTATLTFTLPGESAELAAAQHGARYAAALTSLREELRAKRKHGHNFQTADEALEWMAQLLTEEILVATDVEGSP